jgi:hypothetical protein
MTKTDPDLKIGIRDQAAVPRPNGRPEKSSGHSGRPARFNLRKRRDPPHDNGFDSGPAHPAETAG